ncbi:MAG: GumC family protein, partial [Candidatus Binatia bacterium]
MQTPQAADGSQYDYYQTQFALLQSRTLAARVITDLGLEWNPTFTGTRAGEVGLFDWLRSRLAKLLRVTGFQEEAAPPIGEFELGISPVLINQYLDFLKIMPVPNTRLVRIEFTSPDPRLSKEIANAHVATFLRINLETRFELTAEAREFLEKKLADLKVKVEQSEKALNQFRQQQNVLSLEGTENIIIGRMVDLNKRLTEAQARRIEAESLYRAVENKDPKDLALVVDNPLIQQLKTQLATFEAQAARLAVTFEAAYPPLMELTQQLKEVNQRLNNEIANIVRRIKSDYVAASAQEEALRAEAERQQQTAITLKAHGGDYALLEAELESNRTLYDSVLKRANETNVSGDLTVSNIQVTDRAETPLFPSSPKKGRNLLGAAVFGLLLGGGLAFFLNYLDSTIKTPQDVWQATALPTVGVVPHLSSLQHRFYGNGHRSGRLSLRRLGHSSVEEDHALSQELATAHQPLSIISEAYRTVRTALLLSQAEKPPQVILLTSAHPGEGKTITTLNLAIALAQNGHAVLVIDADLRKGRCHGLLNLRNHRGLANVLTGSLTLEEGVQQTAVEGLFFLSRGEIPPNPVELLGSRKMREVVEGLREHFAFILLDSPP